jgi:hypothetical protein
LDSPATFLSWNFILISVPNVIVIVGMIVVFILALVAPFPRHEVIVDSEESNDA